VLAVLLGFDRLRVSEAFATNVEYLGLERGHRAPLILGKGNKPAAIRDPVVPNADLGGDARGLDRPTPRPGPDTTHALTSDRSTLREGASIREQPDKGMVEVRSEHDY
jgi:hypothetical protein